MQRYFIYLKKILTALLFIVCCIYVLLFSIKNSAVVDIDLLFVQLKAVKIELALVFSFISGGLAGLISAMPLLLRMRKKFRQALKTKQA